MRLSLNDYKSILKYYNIDITGLKNSIIKGKAEDILAEKLCRCIKVVDKGRGNNTNKTTRLETKGIAVCKNSVLTKKNLKIFKFKCKKSAKLLASKQSNNSKQSKQSKQSNNSKKSKQGKLRPYKLSKTARKLRL